MVFIPRGGSANRIRWSLRLLSIFLVTTAIASLPSKSVSLTGFLSKQSSPQRRPPSSLLQFPSPLGGVPNSAAADKPVARHNHEQIDQPDSIQAAPWIKELVNKPKQPFSSFSGIDCLNANDCFDSRRPTLDHLFAADPQRVSIRFLNSTLHDEYDTRNMVHHYPSHEPLDSLPLGKARRAGGYTRPQIDIWVRSKYSTDEVPHPIRIASSSLPPPKSPSTLEVMREKVKKWMGAINERAASQNGLDDPPSYEKAFTRGPVKRMFKHAKSRHDAQRLRDSELLQPEYLTARSWAEEQEADRKWERGAATGQSSVDMREDFIFDRQPNSPEQQVHITYYPINKNVRARYKLGQPAPIPGDEENSAAIDVNSLASDNHVVTNIPTTAPDVSESPQDGESEDERRYNRNLKNYPSKKNLEVEKPTERRFRQYILSIAAGNEATKITLWSVIVKLSQTDPPEIDWKTIEEDPMVRFAPRRSLRTILSSPNLNFHDIGSICEQLLFHDFDIPELLRQIPLRGPSGVEYPTAVLGESYAPIMPEVAVMFRSTAGLRDASLRDRSWAFLAFRRFINSRPLRSTLIPFTTSDWSRPITGQEQGIYTFLATNFLRNTLDALSVIKQIERRRAQSDEHTNFSTRDFSGDSNDSNSSDSGDTQSRGRKKRGQWEEKARKVLVLQKNGFQLSPFGKAVQSLLDINGVIDIGSASLQIVFPVKEVPPDSPISAIDLTGTYLPQAIFPSLPVFATSFMNLGSQRALGLLMKQHCKDVVNGVCYFPCYPKGFVSACVPGRPILKNGQDKNSIEIVGNFLHPTASYCDKSNFVASQSAAIEWDCETAGFSLAKSFEERLNIEGCSEVHGTGNFEQCQKLITHHLLETQLPANQEASSFGAATPSEIGKFLPPSSSLLIVGDSAVVPILAFKAIGLMPMTSNELSGDFHHLANATSLFCATPLHETLKGFDVTETVSLDNFDYCFRASYAYSLLQTLQVSEEGPPIHFKSDLRNGVGEKVGNIGWEIGSLVHTLMTPAFINDMYYLRASHWRPILHDEACEKGP